MQVTPEDVLFVAQLVQELTGVVLDGSKAYLIDRYLGGLSGGLKACAR